METKKEWRSEWVKTRFFQAGGGENTCSNPSMKPIMLCTVVCTVAYDTATLPPLPPSPYHPRPAPGLPHGHAEGGEPAGVGDGEARAEEGDDRQPGVQHQRRQRGQGPLSPQIHPRTGLVLGSEWSEGEGSQYRPS